MLTTTLLYTLGFGFFVSLFNVFLIDRFSFDARQVGLTVAGLGLSLFLVEVLLVEPAKQHFGTVRPLRVAFFAAGLTLLLIALVNQLWQLLVLIPLFALFSGLTRPNLTALISRGAAQHDQGQRLGVNASLQALGRATPPLIAGSVAAATTTAVPVVLGGVSFLLAGAVFVRFYRERAALNVEKGKAALARNP
jgi:DHA1 family tetracycline resistance protein-like MFS transporter